LKLLEQGKLTEGHGRALLLTEDHNRRRQLAKAAAEERWSVRVLEQRARESAISGPQRERISAGGAGLHPDQQAAMEGIGEILEGAWGIEVKVRTGRSGGYRVELEFDSLDDARRLAQGLEPHAPA
jgi:ParB family chromosome partitioning protein